MSVCRALYASSGVSARAALSLNKQTAARGLSTSVFAGPSPASRGYATISSFFPSLTSTKPAAPEKGSTDSAAAKPAGHGGSHLDRNTKIPATLHLKTGESFTGTSFGSTESKFGETVFSTSITSYTESMTDPSYHSQLLVFTTPMIGNYGVPKNNMAPSATNGPPVLLESNKIECRGVIVSDVAEKFSHYLAKESLHDWCKRYNVPGITGVDTRAITNLLRNNGTTLGQIAVGEGHDVRPADADYWDPAKENLIAVASTKEIYTLNDNPHDKDQVRIALLDFGAKANIMRSLVKRGASVTVLPWDTPLDASLMSTFDGLFLSNGPGDPKYGHPAAMQVRQLLKSDWWCNRPVFGICMGNQILGLAAGLETYRMPYGNRGHNQPVLALASSGVIKKGRIYVTSQNHQYAVKLTDFPQGWEPFFINANDSSVEGIKTTVDSGMKVWGVQFHPESSGGPLDTMPMFDSWLDECKASKIVLSGGSGASALKGVPKMMETPSA